MIDVVTLGESMVVMNPTVSGALSHVDTFRKSMAGAESNVAIGLARLGHSASWLSRLGDDEFGRYVLSVLRSEGVDVSRTKLDPGAPTGAMFKETRNGRIQVYYYRKFSAASRLSEEDVDERWVREARLLHVTGITPALSESCAKAVFKAVRIAKEAGIPIVFDPNLRLKLWGADEARRTLMPLIQACTYFLPGVSEGTVFAGTSAPEELAERLMDMGPDAVVVKDGAKGAYVRSGGGGEWIPAVRVDRVVDEVGAGDAFAAGFISGLLEGASLQDCARKGNLMGAYAVMNTGDWEGLPRRHELKQLTGVEDTIR